jgi:hypothetical protein
MATRLGWAQVMWGSAVATTLGRLQLGVTVYSEVGLYTRKKRGAMSATFSWCSPSGRLCVNQELTMQLPSWVPLGGVGACCCVPRDVTSGGDRRFRTSRT